MSAASVGQSPVKGGTLDTDCALGASGQDIAAFRTGEGVGLRGPPTPGSLPPSPSVLRPIRVCTAGRPALAHSPHTGILTLTMLKSPSGLKNTRGPGKARPSLDHQTPASQVGPALHSAAPLPPCRPPSWEGWEVAFPPPSRGRGVACVCRPSTLGPC